jgi:hypothetical protein
MLKISITLKCKIIILYLGFADIHYEDLLEDKLKSDLVISDITGINRVSSRFADRLRFVFSKYQRNEERKLILYCIG